MTLSNDDVAAGVQRFNVSIDSLQRDRFFEMTRRDALPRVLDGLHALASQPGVGKIKINAVALRGYTEDEVLPFARFAREHPFEVRFIEFMPLDADHLVGAVKSVLRLPAAGSSTSSKRT